MAWMSRTNRRLQLSSNSGFERKPQSDAAFNTFLSQFRYLVASIDILHSMVKVFTNINGQSGRVLEKLKDAWYRNFTFTQVKLHATTCLDALLELYATVDGDTFLVSTMNFAKEFQQVIQSIATFYREIAIANENPEIHELNAYIISLCEKNQSNIATLNEQFEKFKQDAMIQHQQCTKRSGFDIDMRRASARPFFQLQKLNLRKAVKGSSTCESVAGDHPLEEKERCLVTTVPTSANAKGDRTNYKEQKHKQNTICIKTCLKTSSMGKSNDFSSCIVGWPKTKIPRTELLKRNDPASETSDRLKGENPTRPTNTITYFPSSTLREMNYNRSKVELCASQVYSLHLKRNSESQASMIKLKRLLLSNGGKVCSQISDANPCTSRCPSSYLNCMFTSNLHKRTREDESDIGTGLSQTKRVK